MVAEEHSPPANAPWLISDLKSLRECATNTRKWKTTWFTSFPGVKSSHDAKNKWAKDIEVQSREPSNILDPTRPHEPTRTLRELLYETCTEQVVVLLIVATPKLAEFSLAPNTKCNIYTSLNPEEEARQTRAAPDFTVVSSASKMKHARTQDVLDQMLAAVNLPVSTYVRCAPARAGLDAEADINFHLPEYLGQTISFPGQNSILAFEILKHGEPESYLEKDCRERAKNYKGLGFLFVRKLEAPPDSTQVTHESHHVLWFSEEGEVDRVRRHLRWAEGETEKLKKQLDRRDNEAADIKLKMIRSEFEYASKVKEGAFAMKRLSATLAVSLELVNDPTFMAACSHPTLVTELLKNIADFWRTSLLKYSPLEIGLGIPGDNSTLAPSYQALLALLKMIKTQLESYKIRHDDQQFEIKFPCLPRKPTKKRAAPGTHARVGQPIAAPPSELEISRTFHGQFNRPAGRAPVDRQTGRPYDWDGQRGVWLSKTGEMKAPGKKKAKPQTQVEAQTQAQAQSNAQGQGQA